MVGDKGYLGPLPSLALCVWTVPQECREVEANNPASTHPKEAVKVSLLVYHDVCANTQEDGIV